MSTRYKNNIRRFKGARFFTKTDIRILCSFLCDSSSPSYTHVHAAMQNLHESNRICGIDETMFINKFSFRNTLFINEKNESFYRFSIFILKLKVKMLFRYFVLTKNSFIVIKISIYVLIFVKVCNNKSKMCEYRKKLIQ